MASLTHTSVLSLIAGLTCGQAIFAQPAAKPKEDPVPERAPEVPPSASAPELEAYAGRLIRKIELRQPVPPAKDDPKKTVTYIPLERSWTNWVRNQVRMVEGSSYQQQAASEDMARINRLGRFRDISSRVDLMSDGRATVTYTLLPQRIVTDVQPSGNTVVADDDVRASVEVFVGVPVDRFQLDRGCRRIEDLYREKGYYLCQVSVDEQVLSETGIVILRIREGEKVKVTSIVFDGNNAYAAGLLKNQIETTEAWLFNKGKLDDGQLDQDVATLTRFYKDRGHLEVRVGYRTIPAPNGKEAQVVFVIEEGPVYTLRDLRVQHQTEGDKSTFTPRFTETQLLALMPIKPGDIYADNRLQDSIHAIEAAYGKLGYTDVRVSKRELRVPGTQQVDMLLIVQEGRTFRTGLIEVQGNPLTRKEVILRQVQVKPERPLDRSALEETKRRLEELNIFAPRSVKVTPQNPDPATPDVRDVLVEVEETNTGSFEFGAAIGSDSGVTGRFGITQRNFDVTDTPDSWSEFFSGRAFRGDDQTFRISLSPGTRYQSYVVSLSEPYLLDSDYSLSTAISYNTSEYDEYTEVRDGAKAALGRRFGRRWNLSMPVRVESVELRSLPVDAPTEVYKFKDQAAIAGIGITGRRSSLDNFYIPTEGSVIELGVEQVGGGDYTFANIHAEHRIYVPLSEDYLSRRTVLSLATRVNYIPGSSGSVPVYERLYLGGQSMRGFGFRTVSPKGIHNDTLTKSNSPIGGTFSFFFGPEVRVPLYEDLLAGVAFVDSGTVNDGVKFSPYRVSVGLGLRVNIRQLSPAPLAFDFAIPVRKAEGDRKRLFTFSVDLPF